MPFAKHNNIVQAIPPDRADQAFVGGTDTGRTVRLRVGRVLTNTLALMSRCRYRG